jgi:hypothetical protein
VLSANGSLNTEFAKATIFGIAEIGGGHASTGTDSETSASTFYLAVNTAALAKPADLKIGFYGGEATGAGVSNITVGVTENGATLLAPVSFDNAADALTYFTDDAIDFGAIAKGAVLDFAITLSVTSSQAGGGFYGNFIIGNAPATLAAFVPETDAQLAPAHFGHVPVHGMW